MSLAQGHILTGVGARIQTWFSLSLKLCSQNKTKKTTTLYTLLPLGMDMLWNIEVQKLLSRKMPNITLLSRWCCLPWSRQGSITTGNLFEKEKKCWLLPSEDTIMCCEMLCKLWDAAEMSKVFSFLLFINIEMLWFLLLLLTLDLIFFSKTNIGATVLESDIWMNVNLYGQRLVMVRPFLLSLDIYSLIPICFPQRC